MQNIILPKKLFSYSQYSLWKRSPDQYREKYYLGGTSFENRETIFGKTFASRLEHWKEIKKLGKEKSGIEENYYNILKRVPKYQFPEHRIEHNIGMVPFISVLDSFSKRNKSVIDYKTGREPWNDLRLYKDEQAVIYSLMVKLAYGEVNPLVKWVWIETEYAPEMQQVGSRQLLGESNELRFTGRIEIFKRRIAEWERRDMAKKIQTVAQEISEDYQQFLKSNGKEI